MLGLVLATTFSWSTTSHALSEWTYHRTSSGAHPNGEEQEQLFLMNRARANPSAEGAWLATDNDPMIAGGRNWGGVSTTALQNAFNAIAAKPPAAFDVRLYQAARTHNNDLIARQAQDHNNQLQRVQDQGFQYNAYRGNVFSYSYSALNAHAAFNIDWASPSDPTAVNGMQNPAGHRMALMSIDGDYRNVGIASKYVGTTYKGDANPNKRIGEYVVTQNFARAKTTYTDHYNVFIVGTVYEDLNSNGRYDTGEGLAGVTVLPSRGAYYAVTSAGGGYSIPVTSAGATTITLTGNGMLETRSVTTNNTNSILLNVEPSSTGTGPRTTGSGNEDLFLIPDTRNKTQYGQNIFDNSISGNSFVAEFENTGKDFTFAVRSFNTVEKFQSEVLLNGQPIGYLKRSLSMGWSSKKTSISITKGMQLDDLNTLEVRFTGNSTWGLTDVKLLDATGPDVNLTLGSLNGNAYGWYYGTGQHKGVVRANFVASGSRDVKFKVKGYRATAADKYAVYLNNVFIQYLNTGPQDGETLTTMTFPSSFVQTGSNVIEVRNTQRAAKKWGISGLKVSEL